MGLLSRIHYVIRENCHRLRWQAKRGLGGALRLLNPQLQMDR